MRARAHGPSGNTLATLAAILQDLRVQGALCDIFGGWAEELLGLREPTEHQDIDLVYRGESFAALEMIGSAFSPVPLKRFHHKRAFTVRSVLCEIILIQDAQERPVTRYWGDVPFYWERPLLHPQTINLCGEFMTAVSAENLRRHRQFRRETQPERWRDPKSLVP